MTLGVPSGRRLFADIELSDEPQHVTEIWLVGHDVRNPRFRRDELDGKPVDLTLLSVMPRHQATARRIGSAEVVASEAEPCSV